MGNERQMGEEGQRTFLSSQILPSQADLCQLPFTHFHLPNTASGAQHH